MIEILFGTFTGQLSLAVILFVIVMAVYLTRMFMKLSAEPPKE